MKKPMAVLVVGAGPLQVRLIQEVKRCGWYAIVTDKNPMAPGVSLADEYIPLNTYNAEAHANIPAMIQDRVKLIGVMTAGADVAPSVAAAATAAGTPRLDPETARLTHDKALVRYTLRAAGLERYQPRWREIFPEDALVERDIDQWATSHNMTNVVIKPRSQCASRGVTLLDLSEPDMFDGGYLIQALQDALDADPEHHTVLIEERLQGTEHSIEAILDGERLVFFNIVDRTFDYSSGTPIETGHVNPSSLNDAQRVECWRMLRDTARVLGATWGAFKIDAIYTETGPKILECTARLSGGWDSQGTTPLSSGRDPIKTLLYLSTNQPLVDCGIEPTKKLYAACAWVFPPEGAVQAVRDWDETATVLGIAQSGVFVKPGDRISYEHCATRPGYVIMLGSTYETAHYHARIAAQTMALCIDVR